MSVEQHTPGLLQQGRLLLTGQTARWPAAEREAADRDERRRLFTNFSAADQGRGRERIALCENEHDARRLVACWNACQGIATEGLEAWLTPPAGSLGAVHGNWANQLKATWFAGHLAQAQCDALLRAIRPLITTRMGNEQMKEALQRAIANVKGTAP